MALAENVAAWSKDPSTKVGAVITRSDNTIASVGFNGFPRGCSDSDGLYDDREEKLDRVVHAELNAILNSHQRLDGCSIYVTHPPCGPCAAAIIQAGLTKVVYKKPTAGHTSKWGKSQERGRSMFKEARVICLER